MPDSREIPILSTLVATTGGCIDCKLTHWNVLFCGRLLIPESFNRLIANVDQRTFHSNQLSRSLEKLKNCFSVNTLLALVLSGYFNALEEVKIFNWRA